MFEDLMSIQAGKETTWGMPVTPTVKLMGITEKSFDPVVNGVLIKDKRGSLMPGALTALTDVSAAGNVKGVCVYEDLCYWNEGMFGIISPSGVGPYVRAGVAPLTATPTNTRLFTIVDGDASDAYQMEGGLATDMKITGKAKTEAMYEVNMLGEKITSGAALAALSDRVVTPMMGDHVSIYVDAVGGTIGSTAIAATGFEFELVIKSNRTLRTHLGSLYPDNYNEPRFTATLKMTLEFNTTSKAYLNSILAATAVLEHQIRIKFTTGSTRIQQYDIAGACLSAPKMFDVTDSLVVFDLEETVEYNAALGNYIKYSNTNGVSALP